MQKTIWNSCLDRTILVYLIIKLYELCGDLTPIRAGTLTELHEPATALSIISPPPPKKAAGVCER